mmetsp:Transcript_11707/g.50157  ORF Transcript_11707/g.50157 Transcript_11707/m.50157 type:complete len:280 (+) Transcript_11707:1133-1972(+)
MALGEAAAAVPGGRQNRERGGCGAPSRDAAPAPAAAAPAFAAARRQGGRGRGGGRMGEHGGRREDEGAGPAGCRGSGRRDAASFDALRGDGCRPGGFLSPGKHVAGRHHRSQHRRQDGVAQGARTGAAHGARRPAPPDGRARDRGRAVDLARAGGPGRRAEPRPRRWTLHVQRAPHSPAPHPRRRAGHARRRGGPAGRARRRDGPLGGRRARRRRAPCLGGPVDAHGGHEPLRRGEGARRRIRRERHRSLPRRGERSGRVRHRHAPPDLPPAVGHVRRV